ncbi:hypothetical protein [Streptomyces yangpuensis]|uniref:hypothetical protein n=1 Tax=Streptomyces yangpuensis TaxID=1648182 RepID=UPI00371922FB
MALKALADLGYLIAGAGVDAVLAVQVGRIPVETVAAPLGASGAAGRRYVSGPGAAARTPDVTSRDTT